MQRIVINNRIEMKRFGLSEAKRFLRKQKKPRKGAFIIALYGNLGSGKTVFTQGYGMGLGIRKRIQSPTFILMRRYQIKKKDSVFSRFYHMDLYRIKKESELRYLELNEIFNDTSGIVVIEWPEKITQFLSKDAVKMRFLHTKEKNKRIVTFFGRRK